MVFSGQLSICHTPTIGKVVELLAQNLEVKNFSIQSEHLTKILQTSNVSVHNLIAIRAHFLSIKKQLIGEIKTLDIETIRSLQHQLTKSSGFIEDIFWLYPMDLQDIFDVPIIFKDLEEVFLIPDATHKSYRLWGISTSLVHHGESDTGISVAKNIPDVHCRKEALTDISNTLAINREYDKAILVAEGITKALTFIISDLVKRGEIEKAASVSKSISDVDYRDEALFLVSDAFVTRKEFDKAIPLANSISTIGGQGRALKDISNALVRNEEFDKAISVAKSISDPDSLSVTLLVISEALSWNEEFDKAISVAKSISRIEDREHALLIISGILCMRGKVDTATTVAKSISDIHLREQALRTISQRTEELIYYKTQALKKESAEQVDAGANGEIMKMAGQRSIRSSKCRYCAATISALAVAVFSVYVFSNYSH